MLRPGGWLVAQEPLRTPPPWSYPRVDALGRHWELLHEAAVGSGATLDAVERLHESAGRAGLELVGRRGFFNVVEPSVGFEIHAGTVAAVRSRLVESGVATESEVDDLEASLSRAADDERGWVTSPFMLDLALRKPSR